MANIWVIIPDRNAYHAILQAKEAEGNAGSFKDGIHTINKGKYMLHLTTLMDDNVVDFVSRMYEYITKLPQLNYIFLLNSGVAPDYPVELQCSYASSEITIKRFDQFIVETGCELSSANSYVEMQSSTPRLFNRMQQVFLYSSQMKGSIKSARGFSSSALIDRDMFKRAQRSCYTIAIADRYSAYFYNLMWSMSVDDKYLALTCINRIVNESEDETDKYKSDAYTQLFATLLQLIDTLDLSAEPIKMRLPFTGNSVPMAVAPAPAAAAPVVVAQNSNSHQPVDNEAINKLKRKAEELETELTTAKAVIDSLEQTLNETCNEHLDMISTITTSNSVKSESDEDALKCKMCYEKNINTVVLPCKHAVICSDCSDKLAHNHALPSAHKCVVCRTHITSVIKMILQ